MKENNKTTTTDRERNDKWNKSEKDSRRRSLPGNYPPEEDVMNRRDIERTGQKGEEFSRGLHHEPDGIRQPVVTDSSQDTQQRKDLGPDELEELEAREMQKPVPKNVDNDSANEELDSGEKNESDVTREDLQALGPKDLSMDMGEDEELLKNRVYPVDMSGEELDIPKEESTEKKTGKAIGPEDEENDHYSIGGDRREDNMEGK